MKEFTYIVPSLGRCGSQLLTEALHNNIWGFTKHDMTFLKMTRPFIREYPEKYIGGNVYKTHLYPGIYPKKCKILFTFGRPLDIILSVINRVEQDPSWGTAHFKNFNADWSNFNLILQKDVLNLEKMFDCFYKKQTCDIICLRYETLWENQNTISEFLGWNLKLPEKKERKSSKIKNKLDKNILKKI